MSNIDTTREAHIKKAFNAYLGINLEDMNEIDRNLYSPDYEIFLSGYKFALSTIDPDALTIESVNAGLDVGLNGNQASTDSIYAYRSNPFTRRIADTIRYLNHDDAIRRECAVKAGKWFEAWLLSDHSIRNPDMDCDELRAAILGKEAEK